MAHYDLTGKPIVKRSSSSSSSPRPARASLPLYLFRPKAKKPRTRRASKKGKNTKICDMDQECHGNSKEYILRSTSIRLSAMELGKHKNRLTNPAVLN
uniref:Uncharacterized protein n=1 Tax=Oryza punctata TaxID=4537 RepID=A0A0E0KLE6_ORYPU